MKKFEVCFRVTDYDEYDTTLLFHADSCTYVDEQTSEDYNCIIVNGAKITVSDCIYIKEL